MKPQKLRFKSSENFVYKNNRTVDYILDSMTTEGVESSITSENLSFKLTWKHQRLSRRGGFTKKYGPGILVLTATQTYKNPLIGLDVMNKKIFEEKIGSEFKCTGSEFVDIQYPSNLAGPGLITSYAQKDDNKLMAGILKIHNKINPQYGVIVMTIPSKSIDQMVNEQLPAAVELFNRINPPHYILEKADVDRCVHALIDRAYGFAPKKQ